MKTVSVSNKDFNLKHTFDCGQCFRWEEENGTFTGVADGKWARIEEKDDKIIITSNDADENFWKKYLDTERDYAEIKRKVTINPLMEKATQYGYGIRLLRQDFFETLMSFIISQRSSIPKIKSSVKKLCEKYGDEIEAEGKMYYSFPTAQRLKDVSEDDFREIGVGYRAIYLKKCVEDILSGRIDEKTLLNASTEKAREMLMTMHGVGDKVCDCVMLFSLAKYDLFPSDVWIKRVMCESFGSSEKDAKDVGEKLFGDYSGFAQQYLFYYRRNLKD